MRAKDDIQSVLNTIPIELEERKDQVDTVPIVPAISTEQINDLSARAGDYEFRPLTEEEKKEFMSNLDAKGRQIFAELAGEAKSSIDPVEDVVPLCCLEVSHCALKSAIACFACR